MDRKENNVILWFTAKCLQRQGWAGQKLDPRPQCTPSSVVGTQLRHHLLCSGVCVNKAGMGPELRWNGDVPGSMSTAVPNACLSVDQILLGSYDISNSL